MFIILILPQYPQEMNLIKCTFQKAQFNLMFTANILLVCQRAEWIWIQLLLLYQFTQGKGSWAGCFTLQLMFHCRKASNNKTPPQPNKRHLTRTPSPLKAGSYKESCPLLSSPRATRHNSGRNYRLGLNCCLAHGKPVDSNK